MKVVLDTNVIVSGHISRRGTPARVYQLWEQRRFEALVTVAIMSEYADVLTRPSIQRLTRMSADDVRSTIDDLAKFAIVVDIESLLVGASVDPDDDIFLECALAGGADYIVSGDRHLLSLETFHGIPIVSPALFAAILDQLEEP